MFRTEHDPDFSNRHLLWSPSTPASTLDLGLALPEPQHLAEPPSTHASSAIALDDLPLNFLDSIPSNVENHLNAEEYFNALLNSPLSSSAAPMPIFSMDEPSGSSINPVLLEMHASQTSVSSSSTMAPGSTSEQAQEENTNAPPIGMDKLQAYYPELQSSDINDLIESLWTHYLNVDPRVYIPDYFYTVRLKPSVLICCYLNAINSINLFSTGANLQKKINDRQLQEDVTPEIDEIIINNQPYYFIWLGHLSTSNKTYAQIVDLWMKQPLALALQASTASSAKKRRVDQTEPHILLENYKPELTSSGTQPDLVISIADHGMTQALIELFNHSRTKNMQVDSQRRLNEYLHFNKPLGVNDLCYFLNLALNWNLFSCFCSLWKNKHIQKILGTPLLPNTESFCEYLFGTCLKNKAANIALLIWDSCSKIPNYSKAGYFKLFRQAFMHNQTVLAWTIWDNSALKNELGLLGNFHKELKAKYAFTANTAATFFGQPLEEAVPASLLRTSSFGTYPLNQPAPPGLTRPSQ